MLPVHRAGPGHVPECCIPHSRLAVELGEASTCTRCGTTWRADGAPAPSPALDAALSLTIADVELALRWDAEERAGRRAGPALPRSALSGWVGAGSAARDATDEQTRHLWDVVVAPTTEAGAGMRSTFVDELVRHCEEGAGLAVDDVDWPHARALAARLAALDPAHRAALRALGRRCSPRSTWDEAAIVVADELAPPALRAAWELVAGPGRPGRPRRDPSQPPPSAERAAWGGDVLRAALEAWARSGEARAA